MNSQPDKLIDAQIHDTTIGRCDFCGLVSHALRQELCPACHDKAVHLDLTQEAARRSLEPVE